jgi:hypothetical protein
MPKRKRLNPAIAAEYRRQGRLFFGAALFFGFGAIVLLGIMAMNQEPSNWVIITSILAMVMSAASLIFGIIRLCQAAGANQGCATVLAIFVGAALTFAMIYQLIWFFFIRKTGRDDARPDSHGRRERTELRQS